MLLTVETFQCCEYRKVRAQLVNVFQKANFGKNHARTMELCSYDCVLHTGRDARATRCMTQARQGGDRVLAAPLVVGL